MKTQRRVSAAVVALLLGGAGIVMVAAPAQAADVPFKVKCVPPAAGGGPVEGTTTARVTAPATAKVGDEVDVTWEFTKLAAKNSNLADIPENSVTPTGHLTVSGAGELTLKGEAKNPKIPKGGEMTVAPMKGRLKLTKAGDITLTPAKYEISVRLYGSDWLTKCTPLETVKAAATIKVTGGSSGGTTSGTTSGTTTGTTSGTTSGTTTGTTTGTTAGTTTGTTTGTTSGTTSGTTTGTTSGTTAGTTSGTTSGTTAGTGGPSDVPGKEVAVTFACQPPGPPNIQSKVTVNAKKNGGNWNLTVKTAKGVMKSPAPIAAGQLKPSMKVRLGGADSGTVEVTGPPNASEIKANDPVDLSDMTGTYKPGKSGKVTLSPGDLTITALGIKIPCKATATAVSATVDTAAQPGGSGNTTTGTTDGNTDGGLADTGASDDGGIKALGLVAGTVLLLGAAVFTFTPWRRLRGTR
ncbi:hypothetical protein ACWCQL_33255 [Streptomyces sp. NPDC002073]